MKLTFHCIGADVRRSWPAIAAWILVVAGVAAIDGIRPLLVADVRVLNLAGAAGSLLWLAELLIAFVLIALVVQTHPLVGSDVFWMTRPIDPRTLLAAKLVLLGIVMVAYPVLVDIVMMAAYHVPARPIAYLAAEAALTRTMIVVLLMTAAALTRNFARFAALCASAIAAVAIVISIVLTIEVSKADFATATLVVSPSPAAPVEEDPTGGYLSEVLVVVVGLAVLAVQYRTRSRLRAVTLGVVGLLLASAAVHEWRWPFLQPRVAVPAWTVDASALRLTADPNSLDSREEGMYGRPTPWTSTRARVHLSGIERGWSATVALLNASIVGEGRTARTARAGYPVGVPVEASEEYPTKVTVRDLLEVPHVIEAAPGKGESPVVFVTRGTVPTGLSAATGRYRGLFRVTLSRHEVEVTLPLTPGTVHQNGSYRIVLDGIERTQGGVIVFARDSWAVSPFDRTLPWVYNFYLRNRAKGEALAGNPIDVREGPFLARLLPFGIGYSAGQSSGLVARGLMIRFPQGYAMQEESPPAAIDDAWIAGAELVITRTRREGSVQRTLEIPDFPLPPEPPP